jgi:hypothetical protein
MLNQFLQITQIKISYGEQSNQVILRISMLFLKIEKK